MYYQIIGAQAQTVIHQGSHANDLQTFLNHQRDQLQQGVNLLRISHENTFYFVTLEKNSNRLNTTFYFGASSDENLSPMIEVLTHNSHTIVHRLISTLPENIQLLSIMTESTPTTVTTVTTTKPLAASSTSVELSKVTSPQQSNITHTAAASSSTDNSMTQAHYEIFLEKGAVVHADTAEDMDCPQSLLKRCARVTSDNFILHVSQDEDIEQPFLLVDNDMFVLLVNTALTSEKAALKSGLLKIMGAMMLNLSGKTNLIQLRLTQLMSHLDDNQQTLKSLYETANEPAQMHFMHALVRSYLASKQTLLKVMIELLFNKIQSRDLRQLSEEDRSDFFKHATRFNNFNLVKLMLSSYERDERMQSLVITTLPLLPSSFSQLRGLLYAYCQGITIRPTDYDFLIPDYLDYCASCIPENNTEIQAQLAIDWSAQRGSESSMVSLSKIPYVLSASDQLFPGLDTQEQLQALTNYIGDRLEQLEGHRNALTNPDARKTFIIQAEEETGLGGYEFRLLSSKDQTPWLDLVNHHTLPHPSIVFKVPTIYLYAENNTVIYQVVIMNQVTGTGLIDYKDLNKLSTGTIFNKAILKKQKHFILEITTRKGHTPQMSPESQEIARLHSALRLMLRDRLNCTFNPYFTHKPYPLECFERKELTDLIALVETKPSNENEFSEDLLQIIQQIKQPYSNYKTRHVNGEMVVQLRNFLAKNDRRDLSEKLFDNFDRVIAFAFAYARKYHCIDQVITALHDNRRGHNFDKDGYDDQLRGFGHSPHNQASCGPGSLGRLFTVFASCEVYEKEQRLKAKNNSIVKLDTQQFPDLLQESLYKTMRKIIQSFVSGNKDTVEQLTWIIKFMLIAPFSTEGLEVDSYDETKAGADASVAPLISEHFDCLAYVTQLRRTYNPNTTVAKLSNDEKDTVLKFIVAEMKKLIELTDVETLSLAARGQLSETRDSFRKHVFTQVFPVILTYYMDASSTLAVPGQQVESEDQGMRFARLISDISDYFEINTAERDEVNRRVVESIMDALTYNSTKKDMLVAGNITRKITELQRLYVVNIDLLKAECITRAKIFLSNNNLMDFEMLATVVGGVNIDLLREPELIISLESIENLLKQFIRTKDFYQLGALYSLLSSYHRSKPAIVTKQQLQQMFQRVLSTFLANNNLHHCNQLKKFSSYFKITITFYDDTIRQHYESLIEKTKAPMDSHSNQSRSLFFWRTNKPAATAETATVFNALYELFCAGIAHATFALAQLYANGKASYQSQGQFAYADPDKNMADLYSHLAFIQATVLGDCMLTEQITGWRTKQNYSSDVTLVALKQRFEAIMIKALQATSPEERQYYTVQLPEIGKSVNYTELQDSSKKNNQALVTLIKSFNDKPKKLEELKALYDLLVKAGCSVITRTGMAKPQDPATLANNIHRKIRDRQQTEEERAKAMLATRSFKPCASKNITFKDKRSLVLAAIKQTKEEDDNLCYENDIVSNLMSSRNLTKETARKIIYDVFNYEIARSAPSSSSSPVNIVQVEAYNPNKIWWYLSKIAIIEDLRRDVRAGSSPSPVAASSNNALSHQPAAFVNISENLRGIINYQGPLEPKSAESGSRYEYDLLWKIIIIGDSGVGKSCLLLRYADDTYTESYISTIGVDFKIRTTQQMNKVIKMQIWDTPGQERFRTIRANPYRGAHAIIICFDLTDIVSFNNVSKWIQEVERNATEGTRIIIVGTKSDLCEAFPSRRTVTREAFTDLCKTHQCTGIETSALTADNVDTAFIAVSQEVLATVPDMWAATPDDTPQAASSSMSR